MAQEYGYDVFQAEEDEINQKRLNTIAQLLRIQGQPAPLGNPVQAFNDSYQSAGLRDELSGYEPQKKDLARRAQESLANALRGESEDIRNLAMDPRTRPRALALMQQRQDQKAKAERYAKYEGQESGDDGMRSYRIAQRILADPDSTKDERDQAKDVIEQFKNFSPENTIRRDPRTGRTIVDPGAQGAFEQKQQVIGDQVVGEYDVGGGNKQMMTRSEAIRRGIVQGNSSPATGGALPAAAGRVAPTTYPPVSGPISPVSGGSALPNATGAARFNFSGNMSPEEVAAVARDVANPRPDPNSVLPGALAASSPPQLPPGMTNPGQARGHEEIVKANVAQKAKMDENTVDFGLMINKLGYLVQMNRNPSYEGFAGTAGPVIEEGVAAFGANTSSKYANTKNIAAAINDLVAPILKQYGYNPSNRDLIAARQRLPEVNASAEGREAVALMIIRGLQAEQEVAQMTDEIFAQNGGRVSASQARQFAWRLYNSKRDEEEAAQKQGRPTGGGEGGALPASTAAEDQKKLRRQLESENTFGGALKDSLKAMASATPFSEGGRMGMADAYGNMWEGGKQMLGMGNPEEVAAERARQTQRNEVPGYAQAKTFHSVFNPATVAGGAAATTLPRAIAAGAALGGLEPTETGGERATNMVVGGVLGGGAQALTRLLPSTAPSKSIREAGLTDAKAAGPVTPTSSQLRPEIAGSKIANTLGMNEAAALDQSKQLTQYLMKEGRIAGDRLTREGVDEALRAAHTEMGQAIAGKMKLPVPETKGVVDAITDLINANGKFPLEKSPLNEFYRAISTAGKTKSGGRAIKTSVQEWDGDKLFQMWNEIDVMNKSKPAQAQAKEAIEALIEASKGPEVLEAFKAAQQRGRHVANIDRVWSSGGGSGTDLGTGFINPSHLKLEAGRGPKDAITDAVTEIVDLLNMRNYKPGMGTSSTTYPRSLARELVEETVGQGLYNIDKKIQGLAGPGSSASRKRIAELLRATAQAGPQSLYVGREGRE